MSRPLRVEYPGAWYHVMNRGRRSENVYLNKNDYQIYIDLLIEACELWSVNVSAYSLMPNHYHLLINTPQGNLSRFMRHVNGVYTQRFNKNHKYEGQLFKGRYKSILVDGDDYLLQLVRYIHRNPLRAKIVRNIDNYEWSSHQGYISNSKEWDWLYKDFILKILSEDKDKWVKEYRNFVDLEDNREIIKIFKSSRWPSLLGSEEFIISVKEKYYKGKINKDIPESYNLSPGIDRIKEVVCSYYKIEREELYKRKRGFNEPRDVAIYLVRNLRKDTLEQIGKDFSLNRHTSVSSALIRIKELMKKDLKVKKKIKEIENRILKRHSWT